MTSNRLLRNLLFLIPVLGISLFPSVSAAQESRDGEDIPVRDSLEIVEVPTDSIGQEETTEITYYEVEGVGEVSSQEVFVEKRDSTAFCPDPIKAVWLSALCPGLGQIYNRSYWKLPIIIGGYLGLIYATNWNARYYNDYSTAYQDAMDNDPNTTSYINFLAYNRRNDPEWIEDNMTWLQSAMKKKKDFYRRYRDMCIISMIGVYFVAMLEAYVDAHLYNFDISENLTMKVAPTVIEPVRYSSASIGFQCAITF
ncbi:MAG: DUF5683 domain-containing protein [Porphyromonadaceae bacterium]|nr:DUF5683 domain-containing protein [Porphyromonadaceae bacterium]